MNREGFNKHKDLILAWASGATIQYFSNMRDVWYDVDVPAWSENYQYRIKPAEPRVWYAPVYKHGGVGLLRSEEDYQQRKDSYRDSPSFDRWIKVVEDTSFASDKPST